MNNKNNYFLNSELSIEEKNKDKAKFHILPVPLEKTVSYGKGTSKGPQAIIRASNELERYTGKSIPCVHGIHTHPLLNCNKPLKVIMSDIENITKKISKANKIPVTLGGEHGITYGAVNGIFKGLDLHNKDDIGIIQIDAHADLRQNYENEVHSHASVMYLLGNEKYKIVQLGVRALSEEEVKIRKVFNTPTMKNLGATEMQPGSIYQTDNEIDEFIRNESLSVYHPIGTCKMGNGAECVVDKHLKVKGIRGLRVADASIFPTIISGNTNATCNVVGAKCADLILKNN